MAHKERHTASKKKGGAVKILLAVVLLLVLAAGAAGVFAYNEIHGNGKPGTEVTVSIPQGSGVAAIAQELKDAGVNVVEVTSEQKHAFIDAASSVYDLFIEKYGGSQELIDLAMEYNDDF